ncbi:MAG: Hsp33 family molecular chaperone HslO [Deltaproteobacteria bacterium]|nr:Hsp33 family molecular chaperone HslO [Deltaproteobacteria bacterium]
MDENITLHLGHYRKYLIESSNLIIVTGEFSKVDYSRKLYEQRFNIKTIEDADYLKLMEAAALSAAVLADKESWGWTLSLKGKNTGFFCAVEPEGSICGRANPADEELSKIYLQRQKKNVNAPMMQSHYDPETSDPVKAIEQYFRQVEQTRTRIEVNDDYEGILLQELPDAEPGDYFSMVRDELFLTVRKNLEDKNYKPLKEFLIFYDCRCNDEMILDMVDSFPESQKNELWDENGKLEMECPRCGRKYIIEKKDTLN